MRDALEVAHAAEVKATQALTMVESIEPQLQSLVASVEGMRRENAEQHRENGRIVSDGFDKLHTRVSSVKTTIDENRTASQAEIKAVSTALTARINKQVSAWERHKDKLLWFFIALALGLLAEKIGVKLPPLF